ncbi:MAG TPA: nucleotidyltransferase domain-containing protein [Dehalococcoidia bacterium]|jgi:hypothetical protein
MTTVVPGFDYDAQALTELCQRWHVRELRLFGSQARGDAQPDSDVDLMISFHESQTPDLLDFMTLMHEFEYLFGKRIDLLMDQPIRNPFRRTSIHRDLRTIYAA